MKTLNVKLAACAALAAALVALPASGLAATVTLTSTLDISTPMDNGGGFTYGWRGFGSFDPAFSFDLAEGDTLDWTVQFAPGQSLTLTNPSFAWLLAYTSGAQSDFIATGSFAFLDAAGDAILTSVSKTDQEGSVHVGQNYGGGDFAGGLPPTLTFSGVHYVGTLTDYLNPDVTTRTYNDPQLLFNADAVPEPAGWALMILGAGLAGARLRARHRRTGRAAA